MNLNKFELELLDDLLSMAADVFGNHGCNDFTIPNTPEARKFMTGVETWNSPEQFKEYGIMISKDGKKIFTQDYLLMEYFADLARKAAKAMDNNGQPDQGQ